MTAKRSVPRRRRSTEVPLIFSMRFKNPPSPKKCTLVLSLALTSLLHAQIPVPLPESKVRLTRLTCAGKYINASWHKRLRLCACSAMNIGEEYEE